MSVEYYYMNDLNTLYNASVGDKTDGGEHHMKMMVAHDNLEAYMQKMEHWRDTALQLSRNNGEAQAKINALEADYVISNRELLVKQVEIQGLTARIAELEEAVKGHDPFEEFPPKERGFECSVVVLGKFEYEDEFNPITNWDLCVYWFDEERWHPLNGYVAGDDIVKWYSLPEEREE